MCDDVAAYRTSLCQSPAIWSRIRAISSSGTTTNTSDKSKRPQFVGLIYKVTKFVTRACRPMSEQPTQNTDKLTSRSAIVKAAEVIQYYPSARGSHSVATTPQHTGYRTKHVGRGSVPGLGEGWRGSGLHAHATTPQMGCAPSGGLHLIGSIQPVREDSTRSEGVESSRSGATPHPPQAAWRSRPSATSPVVAGDAYRRISTPRQAALHQ